MSNSLPKNIPLRQVKSFVLRQGRMTEGQKRSFDEAWPFYGLQSKDGLLNYQAEFGRNSDIVFEIGFGMGASLIEMAKNQPETDFIGVEVHRPGVGRILSDAVEQDVKNLRVYSEDAIDVLNLAIADNSLSKVQVFFPDPWHKKKHHKRRIVQPDFVQLVRKKLKAGGVLHLATDWQHYAEHMLEVMEAAEGFANCHEAGGYAPRPDFRPETKFEKRGERLGHGVWDLLFYKVD